MKLLKKNKKAEMGVGTLIIFIAMILVAAVAASVLISTADSVREQAESTGSDAINNVATGFNVMSAVGTVSSGNVTAVDMYVKLTAGSPDMDLDNVVISVIDGDSSRMLTASDVTMTWEHAASGNQTQKIIGQGDLVKISISGCTFNPSEHVTVTLIPEVGSETVEEFTIPSTLLESYVDLL